MKKRLPALIFLVVVILMTLTYFFEQPEPAYTPVYSQTVTETTVPAAESPITVENFQIGTAMYTGELLGGIPQGYGTMVYATQDSYEGYWELGQPHGFGIFTWASGDFYSGEFRQGERTGTGAYYWANGDIYEGDFLNGQLHGFGILFYQGGSGGVFEGNWENGQKHGPGRMTESDGRSYEGEWVWGTFQN